MLFGYRGFIGGFFVKAIAEKRQGAIGVTLCINIALLADRFCFGVMDFEVENTLSVAEAANKIPWQVQVVNPIGHCLTLQLQSTENQSYHVEIVSMIGQVLYQKSISASIGSQTYSFNLPPLSTGMYILRVYNNQGQIIKKIMKQ